MDQAIEDIDLGAGAVPVQAAAVRRGVAVEFTGAYPDGAAVVPSQGFGVKDAAAV